MKVKFLIAALFFSLVAAAQPSNYIKFNTRGRWIAGMFDSTLHVPRFNGSPSLRTGGSSMDGAIAIDTTNGIFYFYQGGSWKRANLDTSAYAVTSVYRKTASDSVFYVKGGVHTFAFKDSTGGGTPTLQQVLTAGSTLTQNNTITGGLYSFKFTNQNLWSVDTARQWRLRSFRQSDSSMQLIQSSNYGVSGLKRINISSQDTDYFSNIIIDHDHLTNEVYERNPLTLKTAFGQDYNRFSFQGDTGIMVIEANNRRVGIITEVPDSTLHVVGGLKFVTGRQGAGKVLTSDANGGADWATPSGGSYTFTNGLTESGGTVKLGGTLTEHTTIDGNNKIFEYVDGNSFTIAVTDQIQILSNANGFETNSTSATIKAAGTGKESMIIASPDSIAYNPHLGVMRIDTLAAASNMTNKKVMVWDEVTKRWQQISKDSVGGVPTLQQVLTAGSTLTEDGSIILDGNNIEFQGNNSEVFNILEVNSFGVTTQEGTRFNISTGAGSSIYSGIRISRNSRIDILPDSIRVLPGSGNLFIDTLTSAVGTKALRYNPTTGLVSYADTTTGGSGGTPGGSTKQIQYNNAGSFGGAAGFEYQSGSSPNVTITGQNAAHVPLYVKGIGSTQTADLFRVMRYDDSAMFRIAANGSVTLGPQYDYVNAHHAPEHVFKYSNSGYTGGIKLRNHNSGSEVRLHTVNNGLYITDNGGTAAPMTLGTRTNPADASTFVAASGVWTISAGRLGINGTAHASAQLDAASTTRGFLMPRMTGTQAEAISSPAEGLLVYATDGSGSTITSKGWWGYDGAAWVKLN